MFLSLYSPFMMAFARDCFVLSLICFFPYMLPVSVPLENGTGYFVIVLESLSALLDQKYKLALGRVIFFDIHIAQFIILRVVGGWKHVLHRNIDGLYLI
ncbi:hypothetical protein J3E69DRAFT_86064 [Trichoderma sp. SZMC 28015]